MVFNPQGFLVAILEDADQAEQAKAALAAAGFAERDLWVHVLDEADADRAVRCLADHSVLHFRYYGHDSQQDLHIR